VSGIDSLSLAFDLSWLSSETFDRLEALKEKSKDQDTAVFQVEGGDVVWEFVVKPHGSNGYAWLIQNREMSMKIGAWTEPRQRPSAMVDVRSEALWTHGPAVAVNRVVRTLAGMGAVVRHIKPSRLDLCVDVLIREKDWTLDLINSFVTRARNIGPHLQSRDLSGFSIGSGKVHARIYDKPMEIRSKSKKSWMFDIWRLPEVPEKHRVVRVEFQLRREALRDFSLNAWREVPAKLDGLWAYCSRQWLRIVDDARLHHTQQTVLPWWTVVQGGFRKAQGATPLVRNKAVQADRERLSAQLVGLASSMVALSNALPDDLLPECLDRRSFCQGTLDDALAVSGMNDGRFTQRVASKRAKYGRGPEGGSEEATSLPPPE
tara:strand:- start:15201 stop:16325 length:1125 start_codon:yes stop_codon:yes gene_type:complete